MSIGFFAAHGRARGRCAFSSARFARNGANGVEVGRCEMGLVGVERRTGHVVVIGQDIDGVRRARQGPSLECHRRFVVPDGPFSALFHPSRDSARIVLQK